MKKRIYSAQYRKRFKTYIQNFNTAEKMVFGKLMAMKYRSWEDYLEGVTDLATISNVDLPNILYILDAILEDGAETVYFELKTALDDLRKNG